MANKRLLVYADGFKNAFLAEGVDGVKNLEAALNSENCPDRNRMTLVGVTSYIRNKEGVYLPCDHNTECEVINTNLVDFIYGPKALLYQENRLKQSPISVLWGMEGLSHRIVGDVMVSGNGLPVFERGEDPSEKRRKELELLNYFEKQTARNFIPLYNLRADSEDARRELEDLTKGLPVVKLNFDRVLLNNKKQSNSYVRHAIYSGEGSKNLKV
jgi:hypothetical protein